MLVWLLERVYVVILSYRNPLTHRHTVLQGFIIVIIARVVVNAMARSRIDEGGSTSILASTVTWNNISYRFRAGDYCT